MKKELDKAMKEIGQYRKDIEKKILEFARTDLLFFWGEKKELFERQEKEWKPILDWMEEGVNRRIETTTSLDVPDNEFLQHPLKVIVEEMSDKELACFYAAALNMKSVLLALALVRGKIDAEQAGKLSYLEELWQNEIWGKETEAQKRREDRCEELKVIERYLRG